ncbi:MAG: DUF58 domain-containing protein [Thermomicrobiales bacterium]|nr:DUF58 domain-containing protein [Thermomicrobiales bacterium]
MTVFRLSLLVLGALVFAQINEWRPLDQILMASIAVVVIAYMWSRLSLRGIVVTRRVPSDRAQVGRVVSDQITVQNRSLFGKLWLEVRDHSSLPEHGASRVLNLGPRKSSVWSAQTICARRGRYQLGPVSIRSGDPLGIFPARIRMRGSIDVLVYPAVIDLPGFFLPPSALSGGPSPDRRTQTVTPMVTGIREYVQGDAFNRISWSATARLSRLMVKEFDIDPTSDVWLILDLQAEHRVKSFKDLSVDGGQVSPPPVEAWLDSTDEYAVTIVSSLARSCLDEGRAVGMIATGAHYEVIQAERSDRAYIKILESLAVVLADGHRPLSEVLVAESRRFNRNSALIVVTSSTDPSWVDALEMIKTRRVQSSVVFVDGSTFGETPSADHLFERLAKARVRLYRVGCGERIADALRTTVA